MSQNYVGCWKQVYDSLSVLQWVYVTVKECVDSGKEGNTLTLSNILKYTWSKNVPCNTYY